MKIQITFPYQFYLITQIVSLNMDIAEQNLTYQKAIEILGGSFAPEVRKLIFAPNNEVMVVIIVNHKRMDPDDQVPDGAQIILMMPLEGG